jgi:Tol biopolymer transport system component
MNDRQESFGSGSDARHLMAKESPLLNSRADVNEAVRFLMRRCILFLTLSGLLFSLTTCASGLPTPAPTAIPLAATAAPSPRPTRRAATATAIKRATPAIPATETPTPVGPTRSSDLDDLLAERTAQGFLDRLVKGADASAVGLYLTDEARAGEAADSLGGITAFPSRLLQATLLEFRRATASSYEARALLRWSGTDKQGPATQTMTLNLIYQRGLWLIDLITLGDLQALAPTPTRRTTAGWLPPRLEGRLVFQVSSGGDIYTIHADGKGLRRLSDGLDPAWSPDGTQIAFARWRHPWGVYLINPDDPSSAGEERVVDGVRLKEVAWSPDGSQIASTVNYSSSGPKEICFFGFCFTIPAFSVGQIWIAYLGTGEFLSLPLDDQAVHAPTWDPVQQRIVYAGDRGLAWIELEEMETGRFEGGSVWDTSPSFSPDGQQIAFMGRVHDRWEIFVMNADGSGRHQLTRSSRDLEEPPSSVAPAWSPDGKHIVFLSNRDGPWRIYVMDADGSHQRSMFGAELDGLGIRYEWATERVVSWSR